MTAAHCSDCRQEKPFQRSQSTRKAQTRPRVATQQPMVQSPAVQTWKTPAHHHHLEMALTTVLKILAHAPKLYFGRVWGQRKKRTWKSVSAQKENII